jgi:hypothetical protein
MYKLEKATFNDGTANGTGVGRINYEVPYFQYSSALDYYEYYNIIVVCSNRRGKSRKTTYPCLN